MSVSASHPDSVSETLFATPYLNTCQRLFPCSPMHSPYKHANPKGKKKTRSPRPSGVTEISIRRASEDEATHSDDDIFDNGYRRSEGHAFGVPRRLEPPARRSRKSAGTHPRSCHLFTLLLREASLTRAGCQTFAEALGGIPVAPITATNDPQKPFALAGEGFPDFLSAAMRACGDQHNACAAIANSKSTDLIGFRVADCDGQQSAFSLPLSVANRGSGAGNSEEWREEDNAN